MFASILTVIGVVGIVGSLLFSGMQSREIAKQTRLQNASGKRTMDDALRAVLQNFVERPDLRAYFYDGKQPPKDGPDLVRVQTIAEMLADVIESSLEEASRMESGTSQACRYYTRFLLQKSPAFADVARAHSDWFPRVAGQPVPTSTLKRG